MNDRIDELAWEAGCHTTSRYDPVLPAGNGWIINQETLDKFAELIIKECITQAKSVGDLRGANDDMIYGADIAALQISKHFGVE